MAQYRKKPIVIDAIQFTGGPSNMLDVLQWMGAGDHYPEHGSIMVETLEGEMEAKPGDWIIRGVKGELYPIKNDIFEMSYEPV